MDLSIEERVARIEGALGIINGERFLSKNFELASLALIGLGIAAAYKGVGFPNHYYQYLFAFLCVGLAYHRQWLIYSGRFLAMLLVVANVFLVSAIMKVFLGAGYVQPFSWVRIPNVQSVKPEGMKSIIPNYSFAWSDVALSTYQLDLTVVQTFLLLFTLIGGFFGFQPFSSLVAFALVVISIPALLMFNWNWVLPMFILCAVGLYLQGGTMRRVKPAK